MVNHCWEIPWLNIGFNGKVIQLNGDFQQTIEIVVGSCRWPLYVHFVLTYELPHPSKRSSILKSTFRFQSRWPVPLAIMSYCWCDVCPIPYPNSLPQPLASFLTFLPCLAATPAQRGCRLAACRFHPPGSQLQQRSKIWARESPVHVCQAAWFQDGSRHFLQHSVGFHPGGSQQSW